MITRILVNHSMQSSPYYEFILQIKGLIFVIQFVLTHIYPAYNIQNMIPTRNSIKIQLQSTLCTTTCACGDKLATLLQCTNALRERCKSRVDIYGFRFNTGQKQK